MEVYKRETEEILRRFERRQISHYACVAALDSAVAALVTRLRPEDVPVLREAMAANTAALSKELKRRQPKNPKPN